MSNLKHNYMHLCTEMQSSLHEVKQTLMYIYEQSEDIK